MRYWISEDKVVFHYLSQEDSILFLVYLCPSNKPQGTVGVNLSSGPWSFLQSLLQWLQSVTVKGGIDGDIISFLRTVIDASKRGSRQMRRGQKVTRETS